MPWTVLKISQRFRSLRAGETLEVLWSDPDTMEDLFKVLSNVSYSLIGMEEVKGENLYYRMKLKKK